MSGFFGLKRWRTIFAAVVWGITVLVYVASMIVPSVTSAFAGNESGKIYSVRNRLLIEAMDHVGVCDPQSAATVWAEGLKARSAAMQFSVMDPQLRAKYIAQLEKTFPNWVTGVSSPWIDRYEILKITPLSDTRARIEMKFTTATSTGPAGNYPAQLIVEKEENFWRIISVVTGKELNVYTGFLS